MNMPSTSDETAQPRGARALVIGCYLEAALGLLGVFLLAAVVAPGLFNIRNDATVIAALLVWIACPLLLFLLGSHVASRWRRVHQG